MYANLGRHKLPTVTTAVAGFIFNLTNLDFEGEIKIALFITQGLNVNLGEALQFLREYDREASLVCNRVMTAQWNFATNITDSNRRKMVYIVKKKQFFVSIFLACLTWQYFFHLYDQLEEQTVKLKFERASWRKTVSFAWNRVADPLARRQLKMIAVKGRNSLTDDKFNEVSVWKYRFFIRLNNRHLYNHILPQMHHLIMEMKELYNRVRLCPYRKIGATCDLTFDAGKLTLIHREYITNKK